MDLLPHSRLAAERRTDEGWMRLPGCNRYWTAARSGLPASRPFSITDVPSVLPDIDRLTGDGRVRLEDVDVMPSVALDSAAEGAVTAGGASPQQAAIEC